MNDVPPGEREQLLQLMADAEKAAEGFAGFCAQQDQDFETLFSEEQRVLAYVKQRENLLDDLSAKLREAALLENRLAAAGCLEPRERELLAAGKKAIMDHLASGVERDETFHKMLRNRSGECRRKLTELQQRRSIAAFVGTEKSGL